MKMMKMRKAREPDAKVSTVHFSACSFNACALLISSLSTDRPITHTSNTSLQPTQTKARRSAKETKKPSGEEGEEDEEGEEEYAREARTA